VSPSYTEATTAVAACIDGAPLETPAPTSTANDRQAMTNRVIAYVTTNEVRSVPTDPQLTTIVQRPGVVRVPTFHVQLTR
jgi:hypothetical protein